MSGQIINVPPAPVNPGKGGFPSGLWILGSTLVALKLVEV
jgi:hypothetical protein